MSVLSLAIHPPNSVESWSVPIMVVSITNPGAAAELAENKQQPIARVSRFLILEYINHLSLTLLLCLGKNT